MPDAFVYIDESQSPDREAALPGVPFRVGILVLENLIDDEVSAQALRALSSDREAAANQQDKATLSRGYFHASIDSKNAHSALCAAIVGSNLNALFIDMQWHFDPPKPQASSEPERLGGMHPLVAVLGMTSVLDGDYDFINVEIAKRAGTFDTVHAERVAARLYEELLGSTVRHTPQMPVRFPGFNLHVSSGADVGVQVCDFLLWTVQRRKLKNDRKWQDRVGLHLLHESKEVDGHQSKGVYAIGRPRYAPFLPNFASPRSPQAGSMPFAEITKAMLEIEADVRRAHAAAVAGNRRVRQHITALSAAVDLLDGKSYGAIVPVARAFILVCDTLPLYDPTNEQESTRAAEKRLVSAFVLDERFFANGRTQDHWSRWLHQRVTTKEHP